MMLRNSRIQVASSKSAAKSFRSEINILLCGDPGTSKSQLLQAMKMTSKINLKISLSIVCSQFGPSGSVHIWKGFLGCWTDGLRDKRHGNKAARFANVSTLKKH